MNVGWITTLDNGWRLPAAVELAHTAALGMQVPAHAHNSYAKGEGRTSLLPSFCYIQRRSSTIKTTAY